MTDPTNVPEASSEPSPADADGPQTPETDPKTDLGGSSGIADEQLPEDLQPGEDNPLAEPLDPEAEETKDLDELGMDETQEDDGDDEDDRDDRGTAEDA